MGRPLSAETKAKISAARRAHPPSELALETMRENGRRSRGRSMPPRSPEVRARMSAAQKGRGFTPEHLAAVRAAHERIKGKPLSPEHRAALTGRTAPETSARMRGNTYLRDAPVKGECVYCFAPAQGIDHVIPRGRPGWDDPDNVVPACYDCNRSKSNRTPEEWFAGEVAARS